MSLIINPIKTSKSFFFSSTSTSSGASVQGNGIYNNADLNGALNSLLAFQGGNPAILSSNFNDLQSPLQDDREKIFHWLNVISNFIFVGLMGFSLFMAHKNSLEMSKAVDNAKNTSNTPGLDLKPLGREFEPILNGILKTLNSIQEHGLLDLEDYKINEHKHIFETELKAIQTQTNADYRQPIGFTKDSIEAHIKNYAFSLIGALKQKARAVFAESRQKIDTKDIEGIYTSLDWLRGLTKETKDHLALYPQAEPFNLDETKGLIEKEVAQSYLYLLAYNNSQIFERFFTKGLDLPINGLLGEENIQTSKSTVCVNCVDLKLINKEVIPKVDIILKIIENLDRMSKLRSNPNTLPS